MTASGVCMDFVSPHGTKRSNGVVYDVVIGLPTLLFVAFLALRCRAAVRKLARSQSPIMTTYYGFLWVVCAINVLRCGVQMWQVEPAEHVRLYNALWLTTRFGMNFLEVSVVVFLAQGYLVSGRQALVRTLAVAGAFAALDTLVKSLYVFVWEIQLFAGEEPMEGGAYRWSKWGYWVVHTGFFAAGYGFILALPHTRWRDCLPARQQFYRYARVLFAINALECCGALLVGSHALLGYCVYGVSNLVYYAVYPPLLYITFLAEFFSDTELELEEAYYAELREAGYWSDDLGNEDLTTM